VGIKLPSQVGGWEAGDKGKPATVFEQARVLREDGFRPRDEVEYVTRLLHIRTPEDQRDERRRQNGQPIT